MLKHVTYALAAAILLAGGAGIAHQASAQAVGWAAAGPGVGNNSGRRSSPSPGGGGGAVARSGRNCVHVANRFACQDPPRRIWWREGDHRCCHRHVRKVPVRWHGKVVYRYVYGKPHCHSGKLFLKHCVMGRY